MHCATCDTSQALPAHEDAALYDRIYSLGRKVPGYDRYLDYASGVLVADEPLRYLADREDVYWAVLKYLDGRPLPDGAKVLEVGSGLGYLTYAIARRDLDVLGLDLSLASVEDARARYGDYFICDNLNHFASINESAYDAVIMTEVIEHVSRPITFLADAVRLLKPGGEVVLTTPNKSMCESTALWVTEAPPLHHWWFSEKSMAFIASALDMDVRLLDFREYNARFAPLRTIRKPAPPAAVLDENGNVCFREPPINAMLRRFGLLYASQRLVCRAVAGIRSILGRNDCNGRRSQMCAILRLST